MGGFCLAFIKSNDQEKLLKLRNELNDKNYNNFPISINNEGTS